MVAARGKQGAACAAVRFVVGGPGHPLLRGAWHGSTIRGALSVPSHHEGESADLSAVISPSVAGGPTRSITHAVVFKVNKSALFCFWLLAHKPEQMGRHLYGGISTNETTNEVLVCRVGFLHGMRPTFDTTWTCTAASVRLTTDEYFYSLFVNLQHGGQSRRSQTRGCWEEMRARVREVDIYPENLRRPEPNSGSNQNPNQTGTVPETDPYSRVGPV